MTDDLLQDLAQYKKSKDKGECRENYVASYQSLTHIAILKEFISNSQNGQLPVGLMCQLVQRCGVA